MAEVRTDETYQIVERWLIKHQCGHRTLHPLNTPVMELVEMTKKVCPQCEESNR